MADGDATIGEHFDRFAAAWNRGDAAALAGTYVEDGVLIDPFGNAARGREEIEALLARTLSGPLKGSQTFFTIQEVRSLAAGVALVDGTQMVTGIVGPDGAAAPDVELHVVVAMTGRKGQWQFVDGRPYAFLPAPG